jgi:hypothetical protein
MTVPPFTLNKFINPFLTLLAIFLCVFFCNSCKDDITDSHTSSIVFPDSLISFSKHVEPLFRETCLGGQCHSSSRPAKNLNLETDVWSSLRDHTPQIVIPYKGNESLLVLYLDGRQQPQMPLQSPPLTQNQIKGVKKWIDEGASF